jgi:hypothetical protein
MMKYLQSPTMALNAEGVYPYFQMENNYIVAESHSPINILDWVKTYAQKQSGGLLNALVIHSHGFAVEDGQNFLGQPKLNYGFGLGIGTGILRSDTHLFKVLKKPDGQSLVGEIYLTGCGVAQISGAGTAGDGNLFCCEIAKNSGAFVYASPDEQWAMSWESVGVREWRAKNKVEMDGIVLRYKLDGSNELVV